MRSHLAEPSTLGKKERKMYIQYDRRLILIYNTVEEATDHKKLNHCFSESTEKHSVSLSISQQQQQDPHREEEQYRFNSSKE